MLKEYIEKVEKEFEKEFVDDYEMVKLMKDECVWKHKEFIRQSIIGAVKEMGEGLKMEEKDYKELDVGGEYDMVGSVILSMARGHNQAVEEQNEKIESILKEIN